MPTSHYKQYTVDFGYGVNAQGTIELSPNNFEKLLQKQSRIPGVFDINRIDKAVADVLMVAGYLPVYGDVRAAITFAPVAEEK